VFHLGSTCQPNASAQNSESRRNCSKHALREYLVYEVYEVAVGLQGPEGPHACARVARNEPGPLAGLREPCCGTNTQHFRCT